LTGARGAEEIADRAEAIDRVIAASVSGDTVVIAGKGHETGQIVGQTVRPFSDMDEARGAIARTGGQTS
jgi:UDP-N-acetylmuramoyl-L-alanyl-D-glutamate--2,6-diaminopimelate ligase